MNPIWFLFSILIPPAAAVAAGYIFRSRKADPQLIIVLNALMPGSGLAAARRPMLEIVLCVMFGTACLITAGSAADLPMVVPFMVVSGIWALLHTPFSPFAEKNDSAASPSPSAPPAAVPPPPAAPRTGAPATTSTQATASTTAAKEAITPDEEVGYSVAVRCTECGADVEVAVLEHMARCGFCGSDHMVVGHEQTLYVTIPERVTGHDELRNAVLDHYRYQYYLKLYRRSVAPLEAGSTDVTASGAIFTRPEATAAIEVAEAAVSSKADRYKAKLAESLELGKTLHFLAPYRHGMGTLYQAAFGRTPRDKEKALRFAIGTVEAATLATTAVELPGMGKLSYLRALIPAVKFSGDAKALPLDHGIDELRAAYGDLDRKKLVRDIDVIRLGSTFAEEVTAVVWRPWWIAEVRASGIHETLLVDSAAGSVASHAPTINPEILEPLPKEAMDPGSGLRFLPMECPTCGYEFRYAPSAVLHFCLNCHRVFEIENNRKREVDYGHGPVPEDEDHDLVPFWAFPLRIRTGDGQQLIDLDHLRDGIDGTFDQIGDDAAAKQSWVFMPAVRFINSQLMAKAFAKLLVHTLREPPSLKSGRFSLEDRVAPWPVSLEEPEARRFLPLYLATAFGRRDIARVNISQVGPWLFDARQEAKGRLVYLTLPSKVTEPFRRYAGRFHATAVHGITKQGEALGGL